MTNKGVTLTFDECTEVLIALQSAISNAEECEQYWTDLAEKSGKDGFREVPHAAGNAEYYHKSAETLKGIFEKVRAL